MSVFIFGTANQSNSTYQPTVRKKDHQVGKKQFEMGYHKQMVLFIRRINFEDFDQENGRG